MSGRVTIIGQSNTNAKADNYDESTNSDLVSVINPEYGHYTDPEHIVNEVNKAVEESRAEIPMDGFRSMAIHMKGSGVTFKIEATNDPDAISGVDVTDKLLGVASQVDGDDIYFLKDIMPEKLFIVYETTNATNAVDVWIRRY